MARARRRTTKAEDAGDTLAPQRTIPEACPVCEQSLPRTMDEATTHLRNHAPQEPCGHCGTQHTGWTLDWDGIMYPRKDISLFYCSPCGKFAPVKAEEDAT